MRSSMLDSFYRAGKASTADADLPVAKQLQAVCASHTPVSRCPAWTVRAEDGAPVVAISKPGTTWACIQVRADFAPGPCASHDRHVPSLHFRCTVKAATSAGVGTGGGG